MFRFKCRTLDACLVACAVLVLLAAAAAVPPVAEAVTYTVTTCSDCHGYPPTDGSVRNTPAGAVVGSHGTHDANGIVCTACHVDNGTPASSYPQGLAHREGLIEMLNNGTSYSKGSSFAQTDNPTLGTCANLNCHGSITPTWGDNTGTNGDCSICHGMSDPGATGRDTNGDTANTDVQVGAHAAHLNSPTATSHGISGTVVCSECHVEPTGATYADKVREGTGHNDTALPAELSFGSLANTGGLVSSYSSGTCSNTWCHGAGLSDGDMLPVWNTPILTGSKYNDCAQCHGYPPSTIPDHTGLDVDTAGECAACHDHVTTDNDGFNDYTKHINGRIDGSCVGCHTNQQAGATYTRRAITGEFGLAWGHKNSSRSAVTDADCAVCHMEAVSTSDPATSAQHMDEEVDLRDPDTGTQIQDSGADYAFGQFSRDTSSASLETWATVVQNQQCLKCHDSDGAASTAAQVPGGSATDPWNQAASVVDVDAHFATTNASFHPVKGPQNNDFADIDTMETPWNQFSKTVGSYTAGDLITCFDCHNESTPLSTGTVVAHGGSVTLRASVQYNTQLGSADNVATSLCSICHKAAIYENDSSGQSAFGGTNTGLSSSGTRYIPGATGSAEHGNRMDFACMSCHGSSWLDPGRTRRAQDVHGFNTMVGGATTWGTEPDTSQPGSRPYAFLRNNDPKGSSGSPYWDGWRPRYDDGGSTDNTTDGWGCSWNVNNGSTPCSRNDHSDLWLSYGPGGRY